MSLLRFLAPRRLHSTAIWCCAAAHSPLPEAMTSFTSIGCRDGRRFIFTAPTPTLLNEMGRHESAEASRHSARTRADAAPVTTTRRFAPIPGAHTAQCLGDEWSILTGLVQAARARAVADLQPLQPGQRRRTNNRDGEASTAGASSSDNRQGDPPVVGVLPRARFILLPPTGGQWRAGDRAALAADDCVAWAQQELRAPLPQTHVAQGGNIQTALQPHQAAPIYVVYGAAMERLVLRMAPLAAAAGARIVCIHKSLDRLVTVARRLAPSERQHQAAAATTPAHSSVLFVCASEPHFALLRLIPDGSARRIIFPFPPPRPAAFMAHARTVTAPLLRVAHQKLIPASGAVIAATDHDALHAFHELQLSESSAVVQWRPLGMQQPSGGPSSSVPFLSAATQSAAATQAGGAGGDGRPLLPHQQRAAALAALDAASIPVVADSPLLQGTASLHATVHLMAFAKGRETPDAVRAANAGYSYPRVKYAAFPEAR